MNIYSTHHPPHLDPVQLIPGRVCNCVSCAKQARAACSDTWWKGRWERPSDRGSCVYEEDPSPDDRSKMTT